MRKDNLNCDGSGPHSDNLSVRKYPLGGDANAILCRACVKKENHYRANRCADKINPVNPAGFPYQPWLTLEVYE